MISLLKLCSSRSSTHPFEFQDGVLERSYDKFSQQGRSSRTAAAKSLWDRPDVQGKLTSRTEDITESEKNACLNVSDKQVCEWMEELQCLILARAGL